jgi:hypothetical protein
MAKHAAIAVEHYKEGTQEELMQGLKIWMARDFHFELCAKSVIIQNNTAIVILDDWAAEWSRCWSLNACQYLQQMQVC